MSAERLDQTTVTKNFLQSLVDSRPRIVYTLITPMGSSYPALRVGQSSRRKEISRLSGRNRKTIAFTLALVFFDRSELLIIPSKVI